MIKEELGDVIKEYVREGVARKLSYSHSHIFTDFDPELEIHFRGENENCDYSSWEAYDKDGEILQKKHNQPCYALLLTNGYNSYTPNKEITELKLSPAVKNILLDEEFEYLMNEFQKDGIFKDLGIGPEGVIRFGYDYKTDSKHMLYIRLCIHRLLVNVALYSYVLYRLHKDHFPDLPVSQVLFFLNTVIMLGRSGHWFLNLGDDAPTMAQFAGYSYIFKYPDIKETEYVYTYIHSLAVLGPMPTDFLSKEATEVFLNPGIFVKPKPPVTNKLEKLYGR